jgi:hypothetical protein
MNMLNADGELLPVSEWTGFQRDVIEEVSRRAGFTYTLHSPSGDGPSCARNEDDSKKEPKDYAGAYKCGEEDVYNLTRTHAYWAQYYITPSRLRKSIFTVPVLSDVGLTLLMTPTSLTTIEKYGCQWRPHK